MKLLFATLALIAGHQAHAVEIDVPLVRCQPIYESAAPISAMQIVKNACANGGEIDRQTLTDVTFHDRITPALTLTRDENRLEHGQWAPVRLSIEFKSIGAATAIYNALTSGKIKTLILNPVVNPQNIIDGAQPTQDKIGNADVVLDAANLISLNFKLKSEQK